MLTPGCGDVKPECERPHLGLVVKNLELAGFNLELAASTLGLVRLNLELAACTMK